MRIAFFSFGCKVNRAETDGIIQSLPSLGAEYVQNPADADIMIANTCAVTEKAQKDCEKFLKRLKKNNPNLFLIATGCLAELLKDKLKETGADIVTTNSEKELIPQIINQMITKKLANELSVINKKVNAISTTGTRAFLKIQDGCDSFCAYCIIPALRGKPRSIDIDSACKKISDFVQSGYKEIVLTGVHIGMYGKDKKDNMQLTGLLKKLLEVNGNYRVRLSSLDVTDISPELISLVKNSNGKICPHFHISLQSGSKKILSSMGRKYAPADFISAVNTIRTLLPDARIGADVITGFPGETEKLFEETVSLLVMAELNYLHVFPYSKRPGTLAADMQEQVPSATKKQRADRLRQVGKEFLKKSAKTMVGKNLRILAEQGGKGHSDNYYTVRAPKNTPVNTFIEVTITGYDKDYFLNSTPFIP